jgi:uncharacterized repeat protein (TIGR03803 family)
MSTRSIWNGAIIATVLVFAVGAMAATADFIDLTKLKPTVSFIGAPASAPVLSTFTVTATDSSQPGNTAVITALGSCTISGDAVTMTKSTGTCSLKASWAADGNYAAATATQKTKATIGYTESVIYPFGSQNDPDGFNPQCNGLITDKAGNIYGATMNGGGGSFGSDGAVFELSPVVGGGWQETVLYLFNSQGTSYNGYHPCGALAMDSKGSLYGTTLGGGDGSGNCVQEGVPVGCGTVYELSPAETGFWTPTLIYSFTGGSTDGTLPWAGVTLKSTSATVLYGTTQGGGSSGAGTVYELAYTKPTKANQGGWKETVLYNFLGKPDGAAPVSGLLSKNGNLYGTTTSGGEKGQGTVYEIQPGDNGWTENVLYSFCSQANCKDGAAPQYGAPAIDSKGNLYGTTSAGGPFTVAGNGGTVWELVYSPTSQTYTEQTIYSFGANAAADGWSPSWGIVPHKNGWFGANNGCSGGYSCPGSPGGTAFELTYSATAGWQETILYQFIGYNNDSTDVYQTGVNQLIVDTTGDLFGMGMYGSQNGPYYGGVYEISPLN